MKFVIVKDELRIRQGIARLLPKIDESYIVSGEAENGAEGLEVIRREKPDIVITDVRMPVMDGLEMLQILFSGNNTVKAIVLSAYSEFEYARKAMHFGVTEYLLKPINAIEFKEAVERVRAEAERDKKRKPDQIGSMEQVIRYLLLGELELDRELIEYFERQFELSENDTLALFVIHFDEWEPKEREDLRRRLQFIVGDWPELHFCIMPEKSEKEIRILLYGYKNGNDIKHWLQGYFLRRKNSGRRSAMGWTECGSIFQLKENYIELEKYLDWTITLGDDVIISYPEITRVQTEFCTYPAELENQMKLAVCSGETESVRMSVNSFHDSRGRNMDQYCFGKRISGREMDRRRRTVGQYSGLYQKRCGRTYVLF